MSTQVNVNWPKSYSLDRHLTSSVFRGFVDIQQTPKAFHNYTPPFLQSEKIKAYQNTNNIESVSSNSFLHTARLRRNLDESRKAFLNFCQTKDEENELPDVNKESVEQKKTPTRKISFKCKKSSTYRRTTGTTNKITTLNPTTVAELTLKFNGLSEKVSILEQPKFARLVKRVNSLKATVQEEGINKKVVRKPSVKIKPVQKTDELIKVRQRNLKNLKNSEICVNSNDVQTADTVEIPNLELSETIQHGMNVRATIEIFERRSSQSCTPEAENKSIVKVPKPKVPEKSPNIKTKDLVIKNGIKKLKALEGRDTNSTSEKKSSNLTKVETHNEIKTELEDEVQILSIPLVMPRRCDSMYETLNLRRITPSPPLLNESKLESIISVNSNTLVKPNSSFLWRQKSLEMQISESTDWTSGYDAVETKVEVEKPVPPAIPPRPTSLIFPKASKPIFKKKMPLPNEVEKIYEELNTKVTNTNTEEDYEYCQSPSKYEDIEQKSDDGYECFESVVTTTTRTITNIEELYETLPYNSDGQLQVLPRKQEEPLPPRPASRDSYCTIQNSENISNCYESIYNLKSEETISNNYESIYACNNHHEQWESASNRDSLLSSDQQSNSLYSRSLSGWPTEDVYNGKATSDLSGSDKSDEWIDISDNEENSKTTSGFVIVREKTRNKRAAGWSQKIRDQWNKSHSLEEDNSDSDHHYESLYNAQEYRDNECFDSFDSDTESENSFSKTQNDSGVDMGNSQLPDPPSNQSYGLTRLAVSAGKHMKRLRRNWSLTKNDITKSLTRMAKRKSRTDLTNDETNKSRECNPTTNPASSKPEISSPIMCERNNSMINITHELKLRHSELYPNNTYQNVQYSSNKDNMDSSDTYEKVRTSSLSKSKFLNKFRRSMLISTESANEITQTLGHKPKSTFYLTDTINLDNQMDVTKTINSSVSPISLRHSKSLPQRPQSPPPPVPVDANQNIDSRSARTTKRSTSWYAECGLFRNSETNLLRNSENSSNGKRPNTSWYAEIGLYQTSTSTPSSSSTENSGSAININVKSPEIINSTENKDSEVKSESDYYNDSIGSLNSDSTMEKDSDIHPDIQLRLQDEPLYQFYDAAVLESVCHDGTSDFEYDGYEEVGEKLNSESNLTRPSAMQLISPSKNGFTVVRTLWCEIPEVVNSTVLSTLSLHQKKIQEAKFEMITSEASYLNSLNVLTDYFISNLNNSDLITNEEKNILFGKIPAVKRCSEKLLLDLEKCWQGNILLHGICDIVKKNAEEQFDVYVSYCENQILLDSTLKKMRERNNCNDLLKQLECSSKCQSLTLYSFLMLPMQRITRWPLLVDAVLKRLSPQDDEYLSCQYTLAIINKIVMQCNEAARRMEREAEVKKIASQIEFPRGIPSVKLASGSRWLVRSGALIQMLARADDTKLTFGKRFTKVPLHLFLFNDMLFITRHRSDDCYIVVHYCYRSYIELNENDVIGSFPIKDSQGRHLLFLTILENHEGRTVEMLLSCNSESDKERWIEALSPPKSEDPDETLYECWDCPQVTAIHSYNASQPDELPLLRGDVINVIRKMADGWHHGERIRDGQTGWFPANYTLEIANPHVRARNLKQRYRLLALSGSYLKSK